MVRVTRPLPCLALLAFLGGCAAGPDYQPPQAPPRQSTPFISGSAMADPDRPPPDDWWRLYDDPALNGFVAEAETANTDLRAALAALAYSRAVVDQAKGGQYPTTQLGAGFTYGKSTTADAVAAGGHHSAHDLVTDLASADISYEVDLFGRVSRSIDAAQADMEAVEAARDLVRVEVAAETTRAYAAACAAGHELEVARQSLEIAQRSAAIVTRQRTAGAASDFDLARVQTAIDEAAAQLPPLEGRRRAALLELTALLGRAPADAPSLVAGCAATPRLAQKLPVGDGAALLARRPDLRQAEKRLAASVSRIGVATAELYPRIVLGAGLGMASNDILTGSNAFTLGLGPLVSWSFPNQIEARARIAQSDAAAQAALAGFDGTTLRALKEVEQAITALDAEERRRVSLVAAETEASKAFALSHDRRAAGALSQLDLLSAQQTLLAARASLAASDSRVVDLQVTLFKALGGGWREAQDQPSDAPNRRP